LRVAREGVLRVFNLEMDRPGMYLYEPRRPTGKTDAGRGDERKGEMLPLPLPSPARFSLLAKRSRFCQVARRELAGELEAATELRASCDRGVHYANYTCETQKFRERADDPQAG